MLALGSFLGEIRGEGRVPDADVFRGIEDGVAKVARAALLHVSVRAGGL